MSRLLSLVVAAAYVIAAFSSTDGEDLLAVVGFVVVSLACIWFGDELGDYIGWIELRPITRRSPGVVIRFLGWMLLLLPAVVFAIQHLRA
jgi:hypothetical protein